MINNKVNSFAKVTKLFSLVIICHIALFAIRGADAGDLNADEFESTRSLQQQNTSEVGGKLLEIRNLLKQLFFDWNFKFGGESKITDAVGRTFGRIRLIRQMILPMTFVGGFLVAIILFTAKVGVINMILLKGVLLLQVAMIVAKMAWAAKELLTHKSHHSSYEKVLFAQPINAYIPMPHSNYGVPSSSYSSSNGWNRRQEEVFKDYNPSPFQNNQISPYYYQAQQATDYGQPQYTSGRSLTKRSSTANLIHLINNSQESKQKASDGDLTTHLRNRQQIVPVGEIINRRGRFVNQ